MLAVERPAESAAGDSVVDTEGGNTDITDASFFAREKELQVREEPLPHLPSHRFRYTVWHELASIKIYGDELKAPRLRMGPDERDKTFYKLVDSNEKPIHHQLRGRERRNYRNQLENWEKLVACDLTYQELDHDYQHSNLKRILNRLVLAVEIQLMVNQIEDVSSVKFPKCEILSLRHNWINSFRHIPKVPQIKWLDLSDNLIKTLDSLKVLRATPIEYLDLRRNPVAFFTDNYRYRVFQMLPQLLVLDGVRRYAKDDEPTPETYEKPNTGPCVIM